MPYKMLGSVLERLKSQSALIAFGLVLVGAILLHLNGDFRSTPGFLGAALVGIGTLMIGVTFVMALIYEERRHTALLYKDVFGAHKNVTKFVTEQMTEGGDEHKMGKKKSYRSVKEDGETESE